MSDPSFTKLATQTASTKRNPAMAGGKVGAAAVNLTGLMVLPLMPASREIVELYKLKSPRESYVTFTQGSPDILEGDVLVVASVDYRIRAASPWPTDNDFLEIIIERVKGA